MRRQQHHPQNAVLHNREIDPHHGANFGKALHTLATDNPHGRGITLAKLDKLTQLLHKRQGRHWFFDTEKQDRIQYLQELRQVALLNGDEDPDLGIGQDWCDQYDYMSEERFRQLYAGNWITFCIDGRIVPAVVCEHPKVRVHGNNKEATLLVWVCETVYPRPNDARTAIDPNYWCAKAKHCLVWNHCDPPLEITHKTVGERYPDPSLSLAASGAIDVLTTFNLERDRLMNLRRLAISRTKDKKKARLQRSRVAQRRAREIQRRQQQEGMLRRRVERQEEQNQEQQDNAQMRQQHRRLHRQGNNN